MTYVLKYFKKYSYNGNSNIFIRKTKIQTNESAIVFQCCVYVNNNKKYFGEAKKKLMA